MKAWRNSAAATASPSDKQSTRTTQYQSEFKNIYERSLNVYENKENRVKMTEKMSDICARLKPFLQKYADFGVFLQRFALLKRHFCGNLPPRTRRKVETQGRYQSRRLRARWPRVAASPTHQEMKVHPAMCMKTNRERKTAS